MNVADIKDKVQPLLEKHHISYAGVYGSVARGEDKDDSDIDILVTIDAPIGLFTFAGIQLALQDILNRPVDLVSTSSIKQNIKKYIINDLRDLYGQRPSL
ncbi:MAG TPA: nucleotidyltransferase family protein [Candidatus Paceibacterota bacterium]